MKYLVLFHDDRPGFRADYKFMTEEDVRKITYYGEFVSIYELPSPQLTNEEKKERFGLALMSDSRKA